MRSLTFVLAWVLTATLPMTASITAAGSADGALTFSSARVSLEGTSNIHGYTASTTAVRLASVLIDGTPTGDVLEQLLAPGALKSFEIAIPAATLSSPREGIDKNMHKALKVRGASRYPVPPAIARAGWVTGRRFSEAGHRLSARSGG